MMTQEQFTNGLFNSIKSSPVVAAQYIKTTHKSGDLGTYLPEVDYLFSVPERLDFHPEGNAGEHTLRAICALKEDADEKQILAMVLHDVGKGVTFDKQVADHEAKGVAYDRKDLTKHYGHAEAGVPLVEEITQRLGVAEETAEFAKVVCAEHMKAHQWNEMKPKNLYKFCKGFPAEYFDEYAECCMADALGRDIPEEKKLEVRQDFYKGYSKLEVMRDYLAEHPNDDFVAFSKNVDLNAGEKAEKQKMSADVLSAAMKQKFDKCNG